MKLYEEFKLYETLWEDMSKCLWTTPDGREIDLNNPSDIEKEVDILVQIAEQDYSNYNNKLTADGKPARDFSKVLTSEREVIKLKLDRLKKAINADDGSTISKMKRNNAEKALLRCYEYYVYTSTNSTENGESSSGDVVVSTASSAQSGAKSDAISKFNEITASKESVKDFLININQLYKNDKSSASAHACQAAYTKWFRRNTNAKAAEGSFNLKPESVSWNNFVQVCRDKFGFTARDLTALFRGEEPGEAYSGYKVNHNSSKRSKTPISEYFNTITSSKAEVETFIRNVVAPYALAKQRFDVAGAYTSAVAKNTSSDWREVAIDKRYDYSAFKKIVLNSFGITADEIRSMIKASGANA